MKDVSIANRISLALSILLGCQSLAAQSSQLDFRPEKIFDEVTEIVQQEFYDSEFNFESWLARSKTFREQALQAKNHDEFDRVVNQLLKTLGTSHTYYYSRKNPRYFQLFGIFHEAFPKLDPGNQCTYEGIGIDCEFQPTDQKYIVTSLYEGLPAENAGLKYGDELLTIDGKSFHPIDSFIGKTGTEVQVVVQRKSQHRFNVPVVKLDGRNMFEKTLAASIESFKVDDKQIGYVHLRSYAGTKYQELLRSAILFGELSDSDGLILDLRDGWGGADINYLNLFRAPIASIESKSRYGKAGTYSGVWEKPVTLITNRRSTSGKELFAYGFKKLKLGKIVGEKTAGAVVAGRCFPLSNGDALYLAVSDVLVDGERLEGIGVEPDIEVSRTDPCPANAPTKDPQINAAIKQCLKQVGIDETEQTSSDFGS